jgi:chromosomal replication initiation ATPase DnaA
MANYLRTLYERYKTTLAPYTKERLDQLLQWVASEFGVDPSIAFGRKRQRKSVELRQLFTFIAVEALRARKYEIALYLVESFTNVITMYKKTAQLARDKHPFGLYAKLLRDRALARFS